MNVLTLRGAARWLTLPCFLALAGDGLAGETPKAATVEGAASMAHAGKDNAPPLVIGVRRDAPPFAVLRDDVPADQAEVSIEDFSGLSVDICRVVVERLRLDGGVSSVVAIPVDAENRFDLINGTNPSASRLDMLCDPTSVTLQRLDWCSFSFPYFVTGISSLSLESGMRASNHSQEAIGLVGATTAGPRLEQEWRRRFGFPPNMVPFENYDVAITALVDRKISVVYGDRDILQRIASETSKKLYLSPETYSIELYAFCVRPDRPDLLRDVNATLVELYGSTAIYALLEQNIENQRVSRFLQQVYGVFAIPEK